MKSSNSKTLLVKTSSLFIKFYYFLGFFLFSNTIKVVTCEGLDPSLYRHTYLHLNNYNYVIKLNVSSL